jgi:hypothetical protein
MKKVFIYDVEDNYLNIFEGVPPLMIIKVQRENTNEGNLEDARCIIHPSIHPSKLATHKEKEECYGIDSR